MQKAAINQWAPVGLSADNLCLQLGPDWTPCGPGDVGAGEAHTGGSGARGGGGGSPVHEPPGLPAAPFVSSLSPTVSSVASRQR